MYKARHKTPDRLVAVKLLAADRAADPLFADRLLREARALARLNHPNIVTVYEVGSAAGSVFLMMEFVEGVTVRARLRAGPLPPAEGTYVCTRPTAADPFGPPAPYGHDPARPVVSGLAFTADGRVLMGNRSNHHFPGNLLWLARFESDADPFRHLTSFGPVVNAAAIDMSPAPSADGTAVYFQSDRPGGHGGYDL